MEYTLDVDDRIIRLAHDWDSFAIENDGQRAVSDRVLGHVIWKFVDGDEVKLYLHAILFAVRNWQKPLRLPLACHATDKRRHFEMRVTPQPALGLTVRMLQGSHGGSPGQPPQAAAGLLHLCAICGEVNPDARRHAATHRAQDPSAPVDMGTSGTTVCGACRALACDAIDKIRDRPVSRDRETHHHDAFEMDQCLVAGR